MAITKRISSSKIKLVPEKQVPHAILAITPKELSAAILKLPPVQVFQSK
ncbi:MAG: hypothetical protein RIQ94_1006 [Pseudomonadota bacterium]|jgi:hypothetical protein